MGCLSGSMTLQALGGVNLPCGWYPIRGQLSSTGGQEHTHTHIPGSAGAFWFLQVSFEILPDQDNQSTLLLIMASLLEILSSVIKGFELHPLDPKSTLPPLTLGKQVPKTAVLAFKYCGVKKKRIVRNSAQAPAKPQANFQRHNNDEDFTLLTSVQGVIRVRRRENVKTTCNSIAC